MHCLTPSTFWTRLGVPTCPSQLPGTVPSWLGTFASESPACSGAEGATLWVGATARAPGAVGTFFISDLESLFFNKRGQS